jgi:tetratricopeptide (TPR) repeat protein
MHKEITRKHKLATSMHSAGEMGSASSSADYSIAKLDFLWILAGAFLLFFSLADTVWGGVSLSDAENKELYSQGTEYFHQATEVSGADPAAARDLYGKAILRFERIVAEGGIRNGKLFYNIGNIYFLLDDIGRAILNYRRAEQYIPNDANLVKNLSYARSVRQDKMETEEREKILQTLFFFHYDLGAQTRLIFFCIFYIFFWSFAALKVFSKRPFTSWGLGIALLFTLLFGGSLFIESRQSMTGHEGVILAAEVIGRQGDAESYQPSFEDPCLTAAVHGYLQKAGSW